MTDLYELAEGVVAAEWAHDLEAQRIPTTANRPMTPEERSSGVNFATMDDVEQTAALAAQDVLVALSARYGAWLRSQTTEGRPGAVLDALVVDGPFGDLDLVEAARETVNALWRLLDAAATEGWCSAYGELPLDWEPERTMRLLDSLATDQTAWTLAATAVAALVADSRRAVATGVSPLDSLRAYKGAQVLAEIRSAIVRAHRHARLLHQREQLGVLPFGAYGYAAMIYASELLDRNTCRTCRSIDGHTYRSIEEAKLDYPTGTYRWCEAGPRCRGTLVVVWTSETDTPPARPKPVDVEARRHDVRSTRSGWIEARRPGDVKPSVAAASMEDHEWAKPDAEGWFLRRTKKVRVRRIDERTYEAQERRSGEWRTIMVSYWANISRLPSVAGILPPGYAWTFSEDTCTYYLKGDWDSAKHPRVPAGHGDASGEFTSGGSLVPIPNKAGGASLTMDAIPADKAEKVRTIYADRFGDPEEGHRNLVDLANEAYGTTDAQHADALEKAKWYNRAHDTAVDMAHEYRGDTQADLDQTVATIAAMSPGKQWDQNVDAARKVLIATDPRHPLVVEGALRDAVNAHIRTDNANAMRAYETKVRSFKTGEPWIDDKGNPHAVPKSMPKHPFMVPEVDRDIDVNALGALGPGGVRAAALAIGANGHIGVKSYAPLMAAVRVQVEGPEALRGPKVRTFFNNISHPEVSGDTTNDTWHFRALKMGTRTGPEGDRLMTAIDLNVSEYTGSPDWLGTSIGVHPMISDITRAATAEFNGMHGLSLRPHEFQALIWLHMRDKFPLQVVRDLHAEQAGDDDTFKSYRGNARKATQAKARQAAAAAANLSEGSGLLPTYWGSDDPETWDEDVEGEPFDIEPGTFYKSTYDLFNPNHDDLGRFASTSGVHAYAKLKRTNMLGTEESRAEVGTTGFLAAERIETPGGNTIVCGDDADVTDGELRRMAQTVDGLTTRHGVGTNAEGDPEGRFARPISVKVWAGHEYGSEEAFGWVDTTVPGLVNINISEVRAHPKGKDMSMPGAAHRGRLQWAVAHESGHVWDDDNQMLNSRKTAAARMLVNSGRSVADLGFSDYAVLTHDPHEWLAESFADFHLSNGTSSAVITQSFASMLRWNAGTVVLSDER